MQVEVELALRPHDLEALGVGLHHAVFDAVMHHLNEMAAADRSAVYIAILRRQGEKRRLEALDTLVVAANHDTEAIFEAPDAAAGALVDIVQPVRLEYGGAAHIVVEVGIAPVNNRVARLQQRYELLNHLLGHITRRQHDPDRARRGELTDQLFNRIGRVGALCRDLVDWLTAAVVRDHPMPTAQPALGHAGAHSAQSDNTNIHEITPCSMLRTFECLFHSANQLSYAVTSQMLYLPSAA